MAILRLDLRLWLSAVVAAMLAVAANPLLAQTPAEIRSALDAVVRELNLQTAIPSGTEAPAWHLSIPPVALLIAALCIIALLAYQFRDMLPAWRRSRGARWAETAIDGARGDAADGRPFLAHADELAAEGRLVEAMHAVLLQSIAEIRANLDESFADSLTSREILRGTKLSDAGKAALREIVVRVERFYFGEYPAGPVDYQQCRDYFGALINTLPGMTLA